MGNQAVQVPKLVLISFRAFRYFFVQIKTSSPVFIVSSEAPEFIEFMRPYSQQQFVEESEMLQYTMKSFQGIFRGL